MPNFILCISNIPISYDADLKNMQKPIHTSEDYTMDNKNIQNHQKPQQQYDTYHTQNNINQ